MSAGGPIVEPTSRDIIVTPVCAHQLSTRSMVLAPERLVTVQLPRGSRKHLYLAVDGGKALRITGTERVEISCARQSTRLIRLTERNFIRSSIRSWEGMSCEASETGGDFECDPHDGCGDPGAAAR